ncbi:MAG: ATP-binding protein [Planctomycetota bacterium]
MPALTGNICESEPATAISRLGDFEGLELSVQQLGEEIGGIVERLQKREIEVLRGEQLAVVGQLAAGMAHELRNPLMPVKILVQATMANGAGAALKGRELQIVHDEICRLEQSIQAFLDFARPPTIEVAVTDLSQLVLRAVELVSPQANRQNVELHVEGPERPLHCRVDAPQLRQVLLNLILNSMDALTDGGCVRISLSAINAVSTEEFSLQDVVRRGQSSRPTAIEISVTDNGPGFPEELIPRAFEPFISTKETGTGLGLSICQRIVAAHGGTIRVDRLREGGTRFLIRLPNQE